jgi:hypothetical protein
MMRVSPAASVPRNRQTTDSKLAFFLPLVGYWLLAILMVFHPQPPWILVILGSPLVLLAFAIGGHLNERRAEPPHPTVTVPAVAAGRGLGADLPLRLAVQVCAARRSAADTIDLAVVQVIGEPEHDVVVGRCRAPWS